MPKGATKLRLDGDAAKPWEKVVRIEAWVAENLKDKNFKVAFAPASAVARNLSGDVRVRRKQCRRCGLDRARVARCNNDAHA